MSEILAKDPNNIRTLLLSGVVFTRMKDVPKAQNAYEKLLATAPENTAALNNLAWLYSEQLNDPQKGFELIRKARSLSPSDAAVADTYGWLLYRTGQYQQALAVLRDASAQLTQNAEVTYHLGMAAYMMGDKELARKWLQVAADSKQDFQGRSRSHRVSRCFLSQVNNGPHFHRMILRSSSKRSHKTQLPGFASEKSTRSKGSRQSCVRLSKCSSGQSEVPAGIAAACLAQCRSAPQYFEGP
jgi:Tfp pilus assembly protein PilF